MTPQHSYPPGRAFHWGMTAQAYECMKCYILHHNAVYCRVSNAKNSALRYSCSIFNHLVRYSFHCFLMRLTNYAHHLLRISFPHRGKSTLYCSALYTLHPPGEPPWYKFTNYLNTKNRPFFNPSSWTVPVTWRSLERN